jgi:hypothetical protein
VIYELRSYVLAPGCLAEYLDVAGGIGRAARGNDFGVLEGHWYTQSGVVDSIVHLWRYDSLEERERLRGLLGKNERWTKQFLPLLPRLILDQQNQIMNAVRPVAPPSTRGNVYELVVDRTLVTRAGAWLEQFRAALPVRERFAHCVGVWQTTIGRLNEITHLWAHASMNDVAAARASLAADATWKELLSATRPMLAESRTQLLSPSPFSPMM